MLENLLGNNMEFEIEATIMWRSCRLEGCTANHRDSTGCFDFGQHPVPTDWAGSYQADKTEQAQTPGR